MLNAFRDHIYALKRAFTLLFQGKFLLFFIPGIVIAFFFAIYSVGLSLISGTIGYLSYIPWIGGTIQTGIDSTFGWINSISTYFFQFTLITLLSPFHTLLSERVDSHETGRKFKTSWSRFLIDILRTIGVASLGSIMYFFLYFCWVLVAWIFGISFITPFVSALLIGFFTGFNSYDYALERHRISVFKSWRFAFRHPIQMVLTGSIFSLLLYIPFLGVVIAPVLLTLVGTLNYLKIKERKEEQNQHSHKKND